MTGDGKDRIGCELFSQTSRSIDRASPLDQLAWSYGGSVEPSKTM